jgi:sulfate-transporting ATPase
MTTVIQYAVLGLGTAAAYMLLAQGLIIIHSGSGVLNLAHTGMGMLGAYLYWQFHVQEQWTTAAAFAAAVACIGVVGALVHLFVMRPLRNGSTLARVVATLGVLIVIEGVCQQVWGESPKFLTPVIPPHLWRVHGINVLLDRVWLLLIALGLTLVLWLFYRYTRFGLAIQASAQNDRGAATLGWSPDVLATVSWGIGGTLAGVAGIFIAAFIGIDPAVMPALIVTALAGALIGGFTSLWLAALGSLALGIAQAEIQNYLPNVIGAVWGIPFIVIVLILLVAGKGIPARGDVAERQPVAGTGVQRWQLIVPAVIIGVVILSLGFPATLQTALIAGFAWATIMLSVVVLLGYTSQLSFEQMAMAGAAALVAARCVQRFHLPFELAVLIALVTAVPVGAAFAIPALRTRGTNLAVVTLGMGAVVFNMLFGNSSITGGLEGTQVGPQKILGYSLDANAHPERYVVLAFLAFVIVALGVTNLRRGTAGSALLAVRTNERAAAALGISVFRTKLYAFMVGSAIAAIGGIVLAFRQNIVLAIEFNPFQSIFAVSYAVIGGVGFVLGPVVGSFLVPGALGSWILDELWHGAPVALLTILGGVTVLLVMLAEPSGIVEMNLQAARAKTTSKLAYLRVEVLLIVMGRWILARLRPLVGWWPKEKASEKLERPAIEPVRPLTLSVSGVSVRYGGVKAVTDASLEVGPGEVVGLIGPNGAGKTSLIDGITGFTRISGTVSLDGEEVQTWPVYRRTRAGVSRSFQSLELFDDQTVRENLRVASDSRSVLGYVLDIFWPRHQRNLSQAAIAAVHEFQLEEQLDTVVRDLPYGQRRLLAIARAIAVNPSVLLLDEPAAGLSSIETEELVHVVRRLADTWRLAILVVEHDMSFVMGVCDRIVVLDFGITIGRGTPEEVRRNQAVIDAYLGTPVEHTRGGVDLVGP